MKPTTAAAVTAAASIASSAVGYATAHTDHNLGTPFFLATLIAIVFGGLAWLAAEGY